MMHHITLVLSLLALPLLVVTATADPVIVNGTFEDPVPSNDTGGGWTCANLDWVGGWLEDTGYPAPCCRLNSNGSLESDPQIWQDVSGFTPGVNYTVRGEYALMFSGGIPENSFEVRIDGVPILDLGPAPLSGFQPFEVRFVASADSHRIEFAAETNGSDHDYCIDNIAIDAITPNEPTTWGAVKVLYE